MPKPGTIVMKMAVHIAYNSVWVTALKRRGRAYPDHSGLWLGKSQYPGDLSFLGSKDHSASVVPQPWPWNVHDITISMLPRLFRQGAGRLAIVLLVSVALHLHRAIHWDVNASSMCVNGKKCKLTPVAWTHVCRACRSLFVSIFESVGILLSFFISLAHFVPHI